MRYWLGILEMNIFFSLGSSYYSKRSLSKDVILGHISYSREDDFFLILYSSEKVDGCR